MKKILIAGGGYADIPLIKAAKKLGLEVFTSGNRPEELGHQYSDRYLKADFSDKNAIIALVKENSIDYLCPCCNDFSALSCSYAAEQLSLPGFDSFLTFETIHHKDKYREFAKKNSIRTPKAWSFSTLADVNAIQHKLPYPLLVKPVDLSGGKGIELISDHTSLLFAVEHALDRSKAKRIVLEEYIEGTNHGFTAFLINGKVRFYFVDNEYYYKNKYLVSAASTTTLNDDDAIKQLTVESEKIAKLLHLKDGIFHVQFFLTKSGPLINEICRRPPGDLYLNLVNLATGVDYAKWIVKSFMGDDCKGITKEYIIKDNLITRHCIMSDANGKIIDIEYDESIKNNIVDKLLWCQKGEVITDYLTYKAGIVFLQFSSKKEMFEKTINLQDLIKIKLLNNC